jgi:dTMP kinase
MSTLGGLGMGGLFVTVEGGEGVGKSTQTALLAARLAGAGLSVLETREPGGTPTGDRIRELLLDPVVTMSALTEVLLYEASRAELVAVEIAPALARGGAVVCDRFFDSTTAYQAYGRGLDLEVVRTLNMQATAGLVPDLTVLLMLDLDEAMRRATHGGADRMEAESLAFHRRVIEGFAAIAAAEPDRVVTVDASGSVDDVAARVWDAVAAHPALRAVLGRG